MDPPTDSHTAVRGVCLHCGSRDARAVLLLPAAHAVLVLGHQVVPEDLGVCDDLLEERGVREDRLVDLVQLRLVPDGGEQLLVAARELIDVLPAAVVRGELRGRVINSAIVGGGGWCLRRRTRTG